MTTDEYQDYIWREFQRYVLGATAATAIFLGAIVLEAPVIATVALVVKAGCVAMAFTAYARYRGWA